MSDNVFLDTNILVYAHTDFDVAKQSIAQKLIAGNKSFISTQVLQEMANTLNRKFEHSWDDITRVLLDAGSNNTVHVNAENTIRQACRLAARYGFYFYDSMIVSAAIDTNCAVLFSEDLQDGQVIDEKLTVRNPFKWPLNRFLQWQDHRFWFCGCWLECSWANKLIRFSILRADFLFVQNDALISSENSGGNIKTATNYSDF